MLTDKNVSCTFPWIQSMQGITNYDNSAVGLSTCNTYLDREPLELLGYLFSLDASGYDHPQCPGNHILYSITSTIPIFETV